MSGGLDPYGIEPTPSARLCPSFLGIALRRVRVMETYEVENTVKRLCVEASAQRDRRQFKYVLIQLREFLREHNEVLRSMSDDTFEALRKVWYS